uniref:Uncharacterized protein n=1 Tax=Lutzomyia longipalpis TaxID=7200 RepID=A0A7G3B6T2_LUTLO
MKLFFFLIFSSSAEIISSLGILQYHFFLFSQYIFFYSFVVKASSYPFLLYFIFTSFYLFIFLSFNVTSKVFFITHDVTLE